VELASALGFCSGFKRLAWRTLRLWDQPKPMSRHLQPRHLLAGVAAAAADAATAIQDQAGRQVGRPRCRGLADPNFDARRADGTQCDDPTGTFRPSLVSFEFESGPFQFVGGSY